VALTNNSPVATEAPSGVANETLIRTRLEKGIPMLAANSNHAYVLSGLTPDGAVMVNDPGSGIYFTREPMLHLLAVWSMAKPGLAELLPGEITPRSDEDAITTDSDRDGIVDFDEVHRFKTDPHKRDTDGDEVPDFQDLRASIFESPWGYRFRGSWIPRTAIADWTRGAVPMGIDEFHGTVVRTHGRDFDGDRKPMELDEDSDAGGCFDGLEDTNVNGKHEPQQKESYNFSNDDDSCLKGSYEMVTDTVSHANGPAGTIASKIRHAATFSLRPQPDGKLKGIGVFSFTTDTAQQVPPTGCLSKIISPQPTRWTVTLEGDSRRLADGSSEISVNSIPSQGPLHPFRWINDCPPGASGSDLMPTLQWFGFRAKLVNSKYEHRVDTPLAPQVTGTQYTELRVEQPGTGK
jgi:hypothetical protein